MDEPLKTQPELSPTQQAIDRLESGLLEFPQVEMPLIHRFAPGVYAREIFMPKGTFVIGHRHRTEHFNIVLTGRARVMIEDGDVEIVQAPCIIKSGAGIRKMLLIEEDMRWMTIHPTDETDVEKIEDALVFKSDASRVRDDEMARKIEKLQGYQPKIEE